VIRAHNAVARSPLGFLCDTRPVLTLMDHLLEMRARDVLAVTGAVAGVTTQWWLAGGWGVDALVGRQTRRHRDLDIVVDDNPRELVMIITALADLGLRHLAERYTPRSITPRRVWLGDGAGHNVDFLPVDLRAPPFRAAQGAPTSFSTGIVGDARIPCLSPALQIEHHKKYRHRSTDRHDLRLLNADDTVIR
jgi:lincosamide nucleotidyltransferase A/C/D/E